MSTDKLKQLLKWNLLSSGMSSTQIEALVNLPWKDGSYFTEINVDLTEWAVSAFSDMKTTYGFMQAAAVRKYKVTNVNKLINIPQNNAMVGHLPTLYDNVNVIPRTLQIKDVVKLLPHHVVDVIQDNVSESVNISYFEMESNANYTDVIVSNAIKMAVAGICPPLLLASATEGRLVMLFLSSVTKAEDHGETVPFELLMARKLSRLQIFYNFVPDAAVGYKKHRDTIVVDAQCVFTKAITSRLLDVSYVESLMKLVLFLRAAKDSNMWNEQTGIEQYHELVESMYQVYPILFDENVDKPMHYYFVGMNDSITLNGEYILYSNEKNDRRENVDPKDKIERIRSEKSNAKKLKTDSLYGDLDGVDTITEDNTNKHIEHIKRILEQYYKDTITSFITNLNDLEMNDEMLDMLQNTYNVIIGNNMRNLTFAILIIQKIYLSRVKVASYEDFGLST